MCDGTCLSELFVAEPEWPAHVLTILGHTDERRAEGPHLAILSHHNQTRGAQDNKRCEKRRRILKTSPNSGESRGAVFDDEGGGWCCGGLLSYLLVPPPDVGAQAVIALHQSDRPEHHRP